ncbi:hypothetical protein ABC337_04875 [Arthrobacter sp. 1P04PC]|uniref:hypothetical protein n=1 Tax=unclassified Arthrobacter TaxID=235627 RepID=UPI0039A1C1CF
MSDRCCHVCRGAFGVCLTGYRCDHHIITRQTEDADDNARRTYRNPTQDEAIRNVMREQRPTPKAATKRPFSYPKENR